MKSLIIFALLVNSSLARPQRFSAQQVPTEQFPVSPFSLGNNNNNGNGGITVTTVTPLMAGIATTASPQYLACFRSCPSTMEYNPICGTDMENYHNNGRLSCAQRCGKNVAALRMGTCSPL